MNGLLKTLVLSAILVALPATASGLDLGYCNTQEPGECDCGSDCTSTSFDQMITTDTDPATIRQMAQIQTQWSSSDSAYLVTIDATGIPGGGIIVKQGAGIFEDKSEYYDYLSDLLGISVPDYLAQTGELFPPLIIEQNGVTVRFNEATSEYDPIQARSLFFNLLLTPTGSISISDVTIPVFDPLSSPCNGTDPASYAVGTDGNLRATQCSETGKTFERISDESTSWPPPCTELGLPECAVFRQYAQTTLQTIPTIFYGTDFRCTGENGLSCNLETGYFLRPAVEADLALDSEFFTPTSVRGLTKEAYGVIELVQTETWFWGVCSEGNAQSANKSVELNTRDGDYDSSESSCQF